MKAAQIDEYGDPSVIKIREIDKPKLSEGQVLIEVHAASLNPFDSALLSGRVKDMIPLELPVTLGGDIAGVVSDIGKDVSDVAVGDKIYGQAAVVARNSGALAEFAATSHGQVAKMPSKLDFDAAASLPLVGLSALQGLTEHIQLQSGQKLFIHGGAGGIGTIAIQIAKHLGAYVATTATGDDVEKVKQLGADQVVDYKVQDFAQQLGGFDAAFDTVGGTDFEKAWHILKPGGVAVSMIAPVDEVKAKALGISAFTQATKTRTQALDKLRDLVEKGVVKPQIAKEFKLDETAKAFKTREAGGLSGKIVVRIK